MRKENLVRFSAVSVALAMAAGAFMVGCSSDSSSTATPEVDSGTPAVDSGTPVVDSGTPAVDSGTTTDSGTTADAGRDAGPVDAGPPGPTGIVIDVVHASPDTPAVGLCLGAVVGGNASFPAPFDKVQGPLPRYAATQITVPTALQGAIGGVEVRIYVVPGYTVPDGGAATCASVTAAGGSAVLLKSFPAGSFQAGRGYIVAATGCSGLSGTPSVAKCGADATTPTNHRALGAWFKEFDRTFIPAGNVGAQFVHLSPQAESQALPVPGAAADGGTAYLPVFANGVKVAVGLANAADAGTAYTWAAWASGAAPVKAFADPTAVVSAPIPVDPNTLGLGLFTAASTAASPSGLTSVASIPFGFVAAATVGPTNPVVPTYFRKGVTFTFFAVGDLAQSSNPQAPNAGADFFRVLALPNNPPPPASDAGTP